MVIFSSPGYKLSFFGGYVRSPLIVARVDTTSRALLRAGQIIFVGDVAASVVIAGVHNHTTPRGPYLTSIAVALPGSIRFPYATSRSFVQVPLSASRRLSQPWIHYGVDKPGQGVHHPRWVAITPRL